MSEHIEIGRIGEDIACRFLLENGHKIIERNYRKKFGEIDIVSKKDDIIHFVEVKSISRETQPDVSHETWHDFEPEDNVHATKRRRMKRIIEIYLEDRHVSHETWYQTDVVSVVIDKMAGDIDVQILENVII